MLAGQEEVSVHRMHRPIGLDGAAGGHHGLPEHLAAEHRGRADVFAVAAKAVFAHGFQTHQRHKVFDEAGGGGGVGHRERRAVVSGGLRP